MMPHCGCKYLLGVRMDVPCQQGKTSNNIRILHDIFILHIVIIGWCSDYLRTLLSSLLHDSANSTIIVSACVACPHGYSDWFTWLLAFICYFQNTFHISQSEGRILCFIYCICLHTTSRILINA